jgi:hypothetical protein
MWSKGVLILVIISALLFCVCVFLVIRSTVESIHLSFAEEQTEYFENMAQHANILLSAVPPDIVGARDCLRAVDSYYPSGTKQNSGSRLDSIVERHRRTAKEAIECAIAACSKDDWR